MKNYNTILVLVLVIITLPLLAQTNKSSDIPNSIFFKPDEVFAKGSDHQLVVWVSPRLAKLQETLETFPRVKCVGLSFLVLNTSKKAIIIRPTLISVLFSNGDSEEVFAGERWTDLMTGKPGDFVHLGPCIIVVNNEDVSLYELDKVELRKNDFTTIEVSFVVGKEDTYNSFLEKIKGFKINVEPIKGNPYYLNVKTLSNKN